MIQNSIQGEIKGQIECLLSFGAEIYFSYPPDCYVKDQSLRHTEL